MPSSPFLYSALALAALAVIAPATGAQSAASATSTIAAVTLYPGSATVERVLQVPAGSTQAVFACLPAQLDARSLQVRSASGVRIGEVNVQTVERRIATGCADALDSRIRSAEDDLARAQAEVQALELAQTWLNTQAGAPAAKDGTANAQIGAKADALRRSALNTLTQLHQAQRTLEERQRALERVQAEQGSVQAAEVAVVRVTLATQSDADVRLTYQVRGPSWSPSYRARLDSSSAKVTLERLALVAQTTGEDWRGVALTLSTGQPLTATQGPLPRPWTLDVPPPEPPRPQAEAAMAAMSADAMPAPAAPMLKTMRSAAAPLPSFEPVTTQGAYATQFALPQRVTVPSGGERVTLALGAQSLPVTLLARTAPALEPHAWLVAQLPTLTGDWPAGPIALERDNATVGQGRFDPQASDFERLGLSFGRDDRIAVRSEPVQELTSATGFMSGRSERSIERRFTVENRHPRAITVQVLDAAPVTQNAAIRVQSAYTPQPADTAWGGQPGLVLWQQELAAQASSAFTAKHTISHDKDVTVRERH
ncbi:MAG: DUF4139 domain-containing protein [Comamonas sp.]|nr:DUF4139 domain-containing protein [Comamonas sp.]